MSIRLRARKEVMMDAHEGRERRRPRVRVKRVGPRRWMAMGEYGYDYFETIRNWEVSTGQLVGLILMLAGFATVLIVLLLLGPTFP